VLRDAAELAERTLPVRRVHQDAQADDSRERAVRESECVRIATGELDGGIGLARPPPRDGEHLLRRIDTGYSRTALRECDRRPCGAGADIQNRRAVERREERGENFLLIRREQPSDRTAEAHGVERLGHAGVGVDLIAVVIGVRRPRGLP
jgi:hypothetical protein